MKFRTKEENRKKFLHNPIDLPDLESYFTDNGRYYKTPMGDFPSVTTVLGRKLPNLGIEKWKARVGEEEAAKISRQALTRGSAIHTIAEKYLLGEDYRTGQMPVNLYTFNKIRPVLDKNIGTVYGIETALWSDKLNTAGRADLLAGFNGINSVCDFKSSKKEKKEEDIESYFLQATSYSLLAEERTELKFPQIVIIMPADDGDCLVFIKNRDEYVDKVRELFS